MHSPYDSPCGCTSPLHRVDFSPAPHSGVSSSLPVDAGELSQNQYDQSVFLIPFSPSPHLCLPISVNGQPQASRPSGQEPNTSESSWTHLSLSPTSRPQESHGSSDADPELDPPSLGPLLASLVKLSVSCLDFCNDSTGPSCLFSQ